MKGCHLKGLSYGKYVFVPVGNKMNHYVEVEVFGRIIE